MPLYKNMLCLHLECNSGLPVVRREARIVKKYGTAEKLFTLEKAK